MNLHQDYWRYRAFQLTRETSIFLTRFRHDVRIGWPRKPFFRAGAGSRQVIANCPTASGANSLP